MDLFAIVQMGVKKRKKVSRLHSGGSLDLFIYANKVWFNNSPHWLLGPLYTSSIRRQSISEAFVAWAQSRYIVAGFSRHDPGSSRISEIRSPLGEWIPFYYIKYRKLKPPIWGTDANRSPSTEVQLRLSSVRVREATECVPGASHDWTISICCVKGVQQSYFLDRYRQGVQSMHIYKVQLEHRERLHCPQKG